jgi:histone chaperone ASF1
MAKVHVCNVVVQNNPSRFLSKFELEITFECLEELPEDLEWKIIYVGSAESEEFDQVLDTVYVGPVPEGRHKFVFEADPPDPAKIPITDVVGVTVILLTCSYRTQEFIRVGYYVSNDYDDPEMTETPPEQPVFDRLTRNILASNPRVTKFKINWVDLENIPPMPANTVPPQKDPRLMDSPSKRTLAEGDESNSYGGIMDLKSKSEAKGEEEEDMEMV